MRRLLTTTMILFLTATFSLQAQSNERSEQKTTVKDRTEKRMAFRTKGQREPQAQFKKLNLSDEQKEQVKNIMLESKKETLPFENQLREKRARLRTLSSGDTYDVNALNKVVDEMSEIRAEIQKIHIAKKGKIRALLTEEQRIKFDSMPDMKKRAKAKRKAKKRR